MTSLTEQRKKVKVTIADLADRNEKIKEATSLFTTRYEDLMTEVKKTLDLIEHQRAELEKFVSASVKKVEEIAQMTSDMGNKMNEIDNLLNVLKSLD